MKGIFWKAGVAAVLLGVLSGCLGQHKITYDKQYVTSCPHYAKTGETVEFETVCVDDADLYVYLNDVELKCVKEGHYRFVMPDNDVTIEVVIIANGLA